MSDLQDRVHVERQRQVCPYCHDAVVSGDIWVCGGCESAHHAECHREHGGCASCGMAPAPVAVEQPKGAEAPPDPELEQRQREVEALAFTVLGLGDGWLNAASPGWSHDRVLPRSPHAIQVRRVGTLTVARLLEDLGAVTSDPANRRRWRGGWLPRVRTVACYLADEVTPDTRDWIETNQGGCSFFPAAKVLGTHEGVFFRGFRLRGALLYPGLRFLARRVLFPQVAREATREPPAGVLLAMTVGGIVLSAVLVALVLLLTP